MNGSHLLGVSFVVAIAAFQSAYSATVTVTPLQSVEATFQLDAPLPTADVLSIDVKDISNSTDPLTATVYDGDTLLGALTVDSVPGPFSNLRQFHFLSSTSQLMPPEPAPIIDFSSINSGSIDFRLVLSVQSGAITIDTQAVMGEQSWVSFGESEGPGAYLVLDTYLFNDVSVTEIPVVIPVPAAVWLFGSGLLGIIGIARRKKAA